MKEAAILCLILGSTLSVCGCKLESVSQRDLIGKYRAELPDGTELLELLPDGDCIQIIKLSGGQVYEAHGTWKFDEGKGRLYLKGTRQALTASKEPNPRIADPPSGATLGTPVYRRLNGKIAIMLHEGIDYHKD